MALCSLFWSTVLLFSSGTAYDVDFHKSFNYQVSRVLLKREPSSHFISKNSVLNQNVDISCSLTDGNYGQSWNTEECCAAEVTYLDVFIHSCLTLASTASSMCVCNSTFFYDITSKSNNIITTSDFIRTPIFNFTLTNTTIPILHLNFTLNFWSWTSTIFVFSLGVHSEDFYSTDKSNNYFTSKKSTSVLLSDSANGVRSTTLGLHTLKSVTGWSCSKKHMALMINTMHSSVDFFKVFAEEFLLLHFDTWFPAFFISSDIITGFSVILVMTCLCYVKGIMKKVMKDNFFKREIESIDLDMKCSQLIDDLQHAKEKLEHEKDDQNKLLEKKSAECRDLKQELHKRNVEASDELKTDLKMAKKRETEFHQKQANFIAVMEKELTRELNNIKCTANTREVRLEEKLKKAELEISNLRMQYDKADTLIKELITELKDMKTTTEAKWLCAEEKLKKTEVEIKWLNTTIAHQEAREKIQDLEVRNAKKMASEKISKMVPGNAEMYMKAAYLLLFPIVQDAEPKVHAYQENLDLYKYCSSETCEMMKNFKKSFDALAESLSGHSCTQSSVQHPFISGAEQQLNMIPLAKSANNDNPENAEMYMKAAYPLLFPTVQDAEPKVHAYQENLDLYKYCSSETCEMMKNFKKSFDALAESLSGHSCTQSSVQHPFISGAEQQLNMIPLAKSANNDNVDNSSSGPHLWTRETFSSFTDCSSQTVSLGDFTSCKQYQLQCQQLQKWKRQRISMGLTSIRLSVT